MLFKTISKWDVRLVVFFVSAYKAVLHMKFPNLIFQAQSLYQFQKNIIVPVVATYAKLKYIIAYTYTLVTRDEILELKINMNITVDKCANRDVFPNYN